MSRELLLFEIDQEHKLPVDEITKEQNFTKKKQLNAQDVFNVIEVLLISSAEPVSYKKIHTALSTHFKLTHAQVRYHIQSLILEFERNRPYFIRQVAGGYQIAIREEFSLYLHQASRARRSEKISPAALEVLSIIAFKQPVTRIEVDRIRGVDSSGVVAQLIERNFIEVSGRASKIGRPSLYSTTPRLLEYLGVNSCQELKKHLKNAQS